MLVDTVFRRLIYVGLLGGSMLLSSGCATNPATGKQQVMLISEQQEIGMGQQEDQNVVQSILHCRSTSKIWEWSWPGPQNDPISPGVSR